MTTKRLNLMLCGLLAILLTAEALPAWCKSQTAEFLEYFNPVQKKAYLNETQDRSIKKRSFKTGADNHFQPVSNGENGLFAEIDANKITEAQYVEKITSEPGINGFSAKLSWSVLEPAQGKYNWKPLDELIALSNNCGRKLILRISTAGCDLPEQSCVPAWVFEAGARNIQYKNADGKQVTMPIFWDKTYLALWSNFVKELGRRYDGNHALHSVGITGGGYGEGTMVVPCSCAVNGNGSSAGDKSMTKDLLDRLQSQHGMNQKQLIDNWKYVADLFPAAFQATRLNFDVEPLTPDRAGQNALDEISDYLIYRYGRRIFLTRRNVCNGKHDFEQYRVIIKFRTDTCTGYQLTDNISPQDIERFSHTALDDGVSFIELPWKLVATNNELVKNSLQHLRDHLDYQILLTQAMVSMSDQPETPVNASFSFVNLGDNAPVCPEKTFDKEIPASYRVRLEFRNSQGKLIAVVLHTPPIPTTQWVAGKPIVWREPLKMPKLPSGKYTVALSLIDNSSATQHMRFLDGLKTPGKPSVTDIASAGTIDFK